MPVALSVLIAGGGIGGLAAAVAMRRQGHSVTVLERAATIDEVGAGLQLSPNGVHVLRALGVDAAVARHAFAPQFLEMRNFRDGHTLLHTALGDTAQARYGAPYWHIHRADLQAALLQAAEQLGADVRVDSQVVHYENQHDHVCVELTGSDRLCADLLIGADGLHSRVQKQMLGDVSPRFTGNLAWRGTVQNAQLPAGLVRPGATVWLGPGKHVVTYYVRGGDVVNFVAVEECADWLTEDWHQRGERSALMHHFAGWHDDVQQVLAAAEDCFLWALFDRSPLPSWCDGRVALLGDACHPMLPFFAQGAAMALEDAWALSACLAPGVTDVRAALRAYENRRRIRATAMQARARRNGTLFHLRSPLIRKAFAMGLRCLPLLHSNAVYWPFDGVFGYDIVRESRQWQ